MKILVTCPPMLGQIETFRPIFESRGIELIAPKVVQTMSEEELMKILPTVHGWIIGDDPATEQVFEAGKKGILQAVVKWGVGTDNVDFEACKKLGIPVINTPNMFGNEVADIGVHYLIGLARQTYEIDREVRKGNWPKPAGISIGGRRAGVLGYGDIGRAVASRLLALGLEVFVYDPYAKEKNSAYTFSNFPKGMEEADFLVVTCALNKETKHLVNADTLSKMKKGVRIVNVSRGGVIDEQALIEGLNSGHVTSAALDVFEIEPLPMDSPLRGMPKCIFGTHNSSNTVDAVHRASLEAIKRLFGFMNIPIGDDLKND